MSTDHNQRLPSLDGIRGIAILLVMFYHADLLLHPSNLIETVIDRILNASWIGIDFFFALSGFLITRILLETRKNKGYIKNFFFRRVLRIFPIYYLTLAFFFLILPNFSPAIPGYENLLDHQIWFWTYLQNFGSLTYNHFKPADFLTHCWSLAIEEQFYLVWPWLILFVKPRLQPYLFGALILLSLTLRTIFYFQGDAVGVLNFHTLCHLDPLAFGALGAWLVTEKRMTDALRAKFKMGLIATGGILAVHLALQTKFLGAPEFTYIYGVSLLAAFCALIVVLVADRPNTRQAKWFAFAPLQFFGKYSYGLYLYHWPVLWFLLRSQEVRRILGAYNFGKFCMFTLAYLVISILIALTSWYLIERPVLSLKRYFA